MWVDAFAAEKLPEGAARAWRHGGDQVALFHVAQDRIYGVANHCPHEGYPLVQGYVSKGVLTCAWHNFKFDIASGACVLGDEAVRVYPVRVENGRIQVDLTPPDPALLRDRACEALRDAVVDRRITQAVREMVRLQQLGASQAEIATQLLLIDARHARFGTTHGTAVVLEGLDLTQGREGKEALRLLIPGLIMISDGVIRLPERQRPEALPCELPDQASAQLLSAVESEDLDHAEGLLRGLIAADHKATVLQALRSAVAAHFLGFGHPLIYQMRLEQFLEAQGWDHADELLGAQLARIVNATRHDILAPWKSWMGRMEALDLKALAGRSDQPGFEPRVLAEALTDAGEAEAFAVLMTAFEGTASAAQLGQACVLAACEAMRRFNTDLDGDPTCQDDWLNITHGLTTAVALHGFIVRTQASEDVARMIGLCARFLHGMRPLLRAQPVHYEPPSDLSELVKACFDDPSARPIITAHLLKTTTAALQAADLLPEHERQVAVDGLLHLHDKPPRQFNSPRLLHDAWVNVVEGKVPRSLMN